jgi:beta-1,4-mannosyltransferase
MRQSPTDSRGHRPLIVQQSFPEPRPTTNPYIVMLRDAIEAQPGVELRTFSWRRALLARYDVFHAHWPEILVDGGSGIKRAGRQALTIALLAKLRLTRTPIVRTVHNLELPSGISRRQRRILLAFDAQTTLRIRLNTNTVIPPGQPFETIIHGHYREWFAAYQLPEPVDGRFAYFGLIRRYKGVERLVEQFRAVPDTAVSLTVGGRPSSVELADAIREAAADDQRIALSLQFLSDAELVGIAGEAKLIVLPYREMHNSGGALTALSLGRPVLLPANAVNDELSREVGPGWVTMYEGALTAEHLQLTMKQLTESPPEHEPDLSAREWQSAGEAHVRAYRRAIALLRSSPGSSSNGA